MRFSLRNDSRERLWSGFDAALYDTSGGFAETAVFGEHSLIMHTGEPIVSSCRCDGVFQRRFKVPGDIDIVPAGSSGTWHDEGPTSVLILNISLSLVRTTAESLGLNADHVGIQLQLQLKDPRLQHIGWALKAELEDEQPLGRLYADSLGLALTAHLLRRYAPTVPKRLKRGLSRRRLKRVVDYIRDNLTADLRLAELADIAEMSASHFKVLFKQSVGVSVHQFVIRSRVDQAISLLHADALPLSEIAMQTGFANESHMARCVRRMTGMAPSLLKRDGL